MAKNNGVVKDSLRRNLALVATISGLGTLALASFGLWVGGMVQAGNIKDDIINQYQETEVYQQFKEEKIQEIQEKLDNNEITPSEANEQMDDLDEWSFIKSSIEKENVGNEKFQVMLQRNEDFSIMRLVGVIGINAANVGITIMNVVNTTRTLKRLRKQREEYFDKYKRDDDYNEEIVR